MPYKKFDRRGLDIKRLSDRKNKVYIEKDQIPVNQIPKDLSDHDSKLIDRTVTRIKEARKSRHSVILTFGAHTIKNGMGPTLIALIKEGWVTHLATNGAGVIHDWEFAFQGKSSEDVRENVNLGQFGIWDDTNFYINLALAVGAYEGLGYGESVGKMIHLEGLDIPKPSDLYNFIRKNMETNPGKASAALDLSGIINTFSLSCGFIHIPFPYKKYSVQGNAFALQIPFTSHPMFGHDIIYTHPINHGASVGRTAENDFLYFVNSVRNLENGVYMSVGSAVMSPMIFEKSLSMVQNMEIQQGRHIDNHYILVVDLAESNWDWDKDGEPPMDNPSYYLRYCKTFHRMGGEMHYLKSDNRDFLLSLYQRLSSTHTY